MEIFKLFESTIPNVEPGHPSTRDLRRDQLLDKYDEAIQSLRTLIRAKENEITFRRDLIEMLDKSKVKCDNKVVEANQGYQLAKKHAPEALLKELSNKKSTDLNMSSSSTASLTSANSSNAQVNNPTSTPTGSQQQQSQPPSQLKNSDFDIPLPSESMENRSSLDRRLSEFLKTFPNLTQAGLATPTSNNNNVKPMPGYYTQQPPPPPIASAPPLMAMMRFPPPTLMPQGSAQHNLNIIGQHHVGENHDTADMDLSDYEDSGNNGTTSLVPPPGPGIIPMIASAMQQGAGGKQHLQQEAQQQSSYSGSGQQFNNSLPFTARLNPLPFDPSIMDGRIGGSSSSRGDKHSDRASHRHSSSSGSSTGPRHTPDKNKYSGTSSHSSNRSKRR